MMEKEIECGQSFTKSNSNVLDLISGTGIFRVLGGRTRNLFSMEKKLKRNSLRRFNQIHLILEILKTTYPYLPTRDELQIMVRIRRKDFIKKLKYLISCGSVQRIGKGTKTEPYRFTLPELLPIQNSRVESKPRRFSLTFAGSTQ